jgi:hypothetical protein
MRVIDSDGPHPARAMIKGSVSIGDRVVYRKRKVSTHPGPNARAIDPSPRGETYVYEVEKLWTVVEVGEGGRFVVLTRRGKRHVLDAADPNVRRASLWERMKFWRRFPRAARSRLAAPQAG